MAADRLLELVYLMVPAYAANMAPPFVRFWPGCNRPIAARLLGTHKTVVGFLLGVAAGMFAAYVQSLIRWGGSAVTSSNWLAIGLAEGLGAMTGDSMKSFLKRRLRIPPGASWIPFDQLDFVLGALVLVWPLVHMDWADVGVILVLTFCGDLVVNYASFYLGIRKTKL